MTTVSNLPEAGGKTGSLVSHLLSSLQASLGSSGGTIQGLFATLMSQNEIPGPKTSGKADAQNPPASNMAQPSNARSDASDSTASDRSNGARHASSWAHIGKLIRQGNAPSSSNTPAKSANDKSTNGRPSLNCKSDANVPDQTSGNQTNSDPAPSQASANDPQNADQNTANAPNTAPATCEAAPADTANAQNDNVVTVEAAVVDTTSGKAAADAANTDPSQDTDSISDELIALLMQLERLAAVQAQAAAAAPGPVQPAPQAGDAAQNNAADPNQKIDLKSLLDAIAKLNGGDGTGGDTQTDAGATGGTDLSLSTPSTAAQNAQTSSGNAQAQQTTDKFAANALLNLLNVAPGNQTPAPSPVAAFNAAVLANAAIAGDQGGAMDADMQGQNGAGSRNAAGSAATDNASLPLPPNSAQAANPYDFASQLSALRATKGGPTGLPTPVEQVVLQLSRGLSKDGASQMTIQLKPAELGRVEVKLNISSDGKVQGTVTADNSNTLGMLLKDVRGLERALQEAGLRADPGSLQFSLRGDGQPGQGFGQSANGQSGSGGNAPFDPNADLAIAADAGETYYLTPGGVNMRV